MNQLSPEMKTGIDNCLSCYSTCVGMAMNHCLEAGGKHTEPAHFLAPPKGLAHEPALTRDENLHRQLSVVLFDLCWDGDESLPRGGRQAYRTGSLPCTPKRTSP